jgi:hypothetical protein
MGHGKMCNYPTGTLAMRKSIATMPRRRHQAALGSAATMPPEQCNCISLSPVPTTPWARKLGQFGCVLNTQSWGKVG